MKVPWCFGFLGSCGSRLSSTADRATHQSTHRALGGHRRHARNGRHAAFVVMDERNQQVDRGGSDQSRVATLIQLLSGLGQGRVSAGPPDPTGCDLVCNATPMGMGENDPLPVDAALLRSSMFVGDVIAGHGLTPFLQAAESAGCQTANGGHMVEAAQDVMADFMLRKQIPRRADGNTPGR